MLAEAQAEGNNELADEIQAMKVDLAFQDRVESERIAAEERRVADQEAAETERCEAQERKCEETRRLEERRERLKNVIRSWRKSASSMRTAFGEHGRLKKKQGRRMRSAG
jgi:hypothetical protein